MRRRWLLLCIMMVSVVSMSFAGIGTALRNAGLMGFVRNLYAFGTFLVPGVVAIFIAKESFGYMLNKDTPKLVKRLAAVVLGAAVFYLAPYAVAYVYDTMPGGFYQTFKAANP